MFTRWIVGLLSPAGQPSLTMIRNPEWKDPRLLASAGFVSYWKRRICTLRLLSVCLEINGPGTVFVFGRNLYQKWLLDRKWLKSASNDVICLTQTHSSSLEDAEKFTVWGTLRSWSSHDRLSRLFDTIYMLETFKSRVIYQAFLGHSLPLGHWMHKNKAPVPGR